MVFTRQKARSGANPESPPRTRPGTNIRELHTHIQTVFTKEENEIFIQRVLQYSQEANGGELHYLVPGLNYSSTDDDMRILSFSGSLISPSQKSAFTSF